MTADRVRWSSVCGTRHSTDQYYMFYVIRLPMIFVLGYLTTQINFGPKFPLLSSHMYKVIKIIACSYCDNEWGIYHVSVLSVE